MICGSLNRMRIRQSLQPYIPGQERWSPGRCSDWELEFRGLWSNPRSRAAVDCGEMDRGEVREEIVGGNVYGGKPGRKAIKLSNT